MHGNSVLVLPRKSPFFAIELLDCSKCEQDRQKCVHLRDPGKATPAKEIRHLIPA